MEYRDLLVVVDSEPQARDRIAFAAGIADRFGAHLTALYVLNPHEIRRRYDREPDELVGEARAQFESIVANRPFTSEWRVASGFPADVAIVHARYADLTILGQLDPAEDFGAALFPLPADVTLSAGRPVLVTPYAGKPPAVVKTVLIAWDASREAARAVADAMPLLAGSTVSVVCVDPHPSRDGHGPAAGLDIATHLARHGIQVAVERAVSGGVDIGNVLLSRACDMSADLLVMGAYAHSRVRELVLGGTTRTVLDSTTLPTLLAH